MRATTAGWKSKSVFLNIISSSRMSKEEYGTVPAESREQQALGVGTSCSFECDRSASFNNAVSANVTIVKTVGEVLVHFSNVEHETRNQDACDAERECEYQSAHNKTGDSRLTEDESRIAVRFGVDTFDLRCEWLHDFFTLG